MNEDRAFTFTKSSMKPRIPSKSEFPPGTQFVVKDFDVPLARIPRDDRSIWINWFGGVPRPYDEESLRVDNNWPADSFESWTALIAESLPKDE